MAELDWLMQQAKRYPLLNAEQEIELSRQVQTWLQLKDKPKLSLEEQAALRRGKKAYDRFFMSNIAMVVKLANRYNHSHIAGSLTLEDLVQEGIFGLQRAIVMFDATRGYKFSTYAFNWIRQCICRGVERRASAIYLPCTAHAMIRSVRKYIREQEQLTGRTPSITEAAQALKMDEPKLRQALHLHLQVSSLDEPAPSQTNRRNQATVLDMIASDAPEPSQLAELNNILEAVPQLLKTLPPRQREIISRRYLNGTPDTFESIAKEWGVSREAVRDTHKRAINLLRRRFTVVATPADIQALQCA